ncbi:ArsR family transcriptional regulator, partial [Thermococcus sp.]
MVQSIEELARVCDALSNPVRVKILKLLCEKEWYVYELAKTLG